MEIVNFAAMRIVKSCFVYIGHLIQIDFFLSTFAGVLHFLCLSKSLSRMCNLNFFIPEQHD